MNIFRKATDGGGRSSQGSVEIIVVPGPNLRPPTFSKESYEVSVNEASPIGTSVTAMKAVDPENEAVAYSIVSGNEQGHFQIGTSTGLVTVAGNIDREQLSRYSLVSFIYGVTGSNFLNLGIHLQVNCQCLAETW